jgi:hypothetical protein
MPHLILFFALLLTSCGAIQGGSIQPVESDFDFQPYIDDFEIAIGVHVDVPIDIMPGYYFSRRQTDGVRTDGQCVHGKRVIINEDVIKEALSKDNTYDWMLPLIYHELGHCVLNLRHDDTLIKRGIPASWMYPYQQTPHTWHQMGYDFYRTQMSASYWRNHP